MKDVRDLIVHEVFLLGGGIIRIPVRMMKKGVATSSCESGYNNAKESAREVS